MHKNLLLFHYDCAQKGALFCDGNFLQIKVKTHLNSGCGGLQVCCSLLIDETRLNNLGLWKDINLEWGICESDCRAKRK